MSDKWNLISWIVRQVRRQTSCMDLSFRHQRKRFFRCITHTECDIKGATKSYFTHYSCVVIVFFNTALCRLAFSTVSFRKLVFHPVFSLNQDIKIGVIMYVFWHVNENSPFINNKLLAKILQYYVKTCLWRCFEFFKKNSFIKESVKQSKNKECKKRYHKKSQLRKILKYV